MNPQYLRPETSHRDRWMVSYLDVVTILLIFFVAAAAKTMAPPAPPPPPPSAPEKPKPLSELETSLSKTGLEVHREARGLVISLPQAILFSSGDDRIVESAISTVDQIAAAIRPIPNHVILIGHADSSPIHNRRFRDNWDLSAARGVRLLELLTDRYGIEESRLSVSGEGSNHPRQPNDTPDGRASNRRVEIVILENFSESASSDSTR